MKLPLLPQDKANHAVYSAAAVAVLALLLRWVGVPAMASVYLSTLAVLLVGAWKELVHDREQKKGQPEWRDMGANVLGVTIAAASFAAGMWEA
jgi:membrane protein implicated in regulation of membrane protease activity